MAQGKMRRLEGFVLLFNNLKEVARNDPKKLEIFYEQNPKLKKAADNLFQCTGLGDFERRIFHGRKKYFPQAPDGFDKSWKEYKEIWEGPLLDCYFNGFDDLFLETEEISEEGNSRSQIELEAPDPSFDLEYDPLNHDGGKAFEMAFLAADSYAGNVGTDFEDTIHTESAIGLTAYDYLKNTIGFDASEVFRRWRQLPVIFMPAHVSNKHGLTKRGSIYELIDDAVRAYVFGAPAAAIAMCRAILEIILKEHYNLETQRKDKNGKLRYKGLGELIIMADERYEFFQGKRVQKLSGVANKIMHQYSSRNKITDEDEKIIIEFFKTNKYLLERAPGNK